VRIRRTVTKELKRQIAYDILRETITTVAICRKYSITYPVVCIWKKGYAMGRLDNKPTTKCGNSFF